MMRTQPPGFRWLVGGFALVAAVAFGLHYRSAGDRADLLLGVLCLAAAGYWLIFDREPAADDATEAASYGVDFVPDDDPAGSPGRGEEAAPGHGWDESR